MANPILVGRASYAATIKKTGRAPSGGLRNFKQMSDAKFRQTVNAIVTEDNDPEALEAVKKESKRRFGSKLTKADIFQLEEIHKAVHNLLDHLTRDGKIDPAVDHAHWFTSRGWADPPLP